MKKLEFQTKVVDKTVHLKIAGDIAADNAEFLRQSLKRDVPAGAREIFIDMAGVRRADTAGLAVLADLAGRAKVCLCGVKPAVRAMLDLLGAGLFQVFESVDEAVRQTKALRPARLHDPTQRVP